MNTIDYRKNYNFKEYVTVRPLAVTQIDNIYTKNNEAKSIESMSLGGMSVKEDDHTLFLAQKKIND
jgi:hypothetical protein